MTRATTPHQQFLAKRRAEIDALMAKLGFIKMTLAEYNTGPAVYWQWAAREVPVVEDLPDHPNRTVTGGRIYIADYAEIYIDHIRRPAFSKRYTLAIGAHIKVPQQALGSADPSDIVYQSPASLRKHGLDAQLEKYGLTR